MLLNIEIRRLHVVLRQLSDHIDALELKLAKSKSPKKEFFAENLEQKKPQISPKKPRESQSKDLTLL